MAIFRENIPAYNKSHLHKFHLQSVRDLGYSFVGHDKLLQFDMLGVSILRNICINFRVAIPENLQNIDGRCMIPYQQRIPQGHKALLHGWKHVTTGILTPKQVAIKGRQQLSRDGLTDVNGDWLQPPNISDDMTVKINSEHTNTCPALWNLVQFFLCDTCTNIDLSFCLYATFTKPLKKMLVKFSIRDQQNMMSAKLYLKLFSLVSPMAAIEQSCFLTKL